MIYPQRFCRSFGRLDQENFAELSGDYNPIHIDPLAARRTKFGEVVVHGMHSLLWGLDAIISNLKGPCALGTLECQFPSFVSLDKQANLVISGEDAGKVSGEIIQGSSTCLRFKFELISPRNEPELPIILERPPLQRPDELTADDFSSASGKTFSLPLCLDQSLAEKLFPALVNKLPRWQLALLLAISRLIGMKCPGLHSILAGLDLDMSAFGNGASDLSYEIKRWDPRFSMLFVGIRSAAAAGEIKAFLRPPTVIQPSCAELSELLVPGEFAGQSFLIVGGARGLGEVAAKLAAAGGGKVCITYSKDAQGAARVCEEIKRFGGEAVSMALDVTASGDGISEMLAKASAPTQVYYFATPAIFNTERDQFEADVLQNFLNYYLLGFQKLILKLGEIFPGHGFKVFYPSSVAVDEVPLEMGEYAAAKAAGEIFCAFAEKAGSVKSIRCPRLPRLATDQTVSLLPVNNLPPAPLLLKEMRALSVD